MAYDSPKRPLVFPLKNPTVTMAITEEDGECTPSSFVWPEDSDERVLVPFFLSLNEYNVLANAIEVGRDIAYDKDSIPVLWLWLRNMRCEVSICDMIINCIQNNPATLQAIIDGLTASNEFKTYISETVQGMTEGQIISPLVAGSCNNSILAGKMITLVERLDTNNIDALDIIEIGTNDEEKVAALLEGIPIAGELPFGDIIDFTQDLLEDFGENYDAASTIERKDNLARDLYCFAKEKPDCELTFADLFEFFQNRVSSGLTLESLIQNIVEWVITGDFSTDDLVFDGMMALQIAAIRTGQEFFGIDAPKIGTLTRDALPSSAWEDWDLCVEPEGCEGGEAMDFTQGNYGFTLFAGRGTWVEGEGWTIGELPANPTRISLLRVVLPIPTKMKFYTTAPVGEIRVYRSSGGTLITLLGATTTFTEEDSGLWSSEIPTMYEYEGNEIMIDLGTSGTLEGIYFVRMCWNYD